MSRPKALAAPRRCYYQEEELPDGYAEARGEWDWDKGGAPPKHCANWVNQRRPRRAYWQRWVRTTGKEAEHMCWAYICDLCWRAQREMDEYGDWEGWPVGEDGKFIPSQECAIP